MKLFYYVPDVEHEGDVSYEENKLREMGAEIIRTDIDWGDEEIEEACIVINIDHCDKNKFMDYGCIE